MAKNTVKLVNPKKNIQIQNSLFGTDNDILASWLNLVELNDKISCNQNKFISYFLEDGLRDNKSANNAC